MRKHFLSSDLAPKKPISQNVSLEDVRRKRKDKVVIVQTQAHTCTHTLGFAGELSWEATSIYIQYVCTFRNANRFFANRFALDLSHEANFANKQAMPLVSSLQSFEQRV